jgi:transcriptional regulator
LYTPSYFRQDSPEAIRQIIENYSFGTMITPDGDSLAVTHLPFLFDARSGEHGKLRSHMARQNPHWEQFLAKETLVIFQGPHAYVSPTWYVDQFSVPTWNYAVVHAYGLPVLLDDEQSLQLLVETLNLFEAPESTYDMERGMAYIQKSLRGIVAFEIPIARVECKFKMSQNKTDGDRMRVIEHLSESEECLARDVATLMRNM